MPDVLYRWPSTAQFGRRVPKEKFYEQGKVSSAAKDAFVAEVKRITWAYKLAEPTIHLPGNDEIREIQVFEITAKGDDVSELVLAAIDKAIPFPIIFEIVRTNDDGQRETRMVAAHKQLSVGAPKLGPYNSTAWLPEETERQPIPTAIHLPALLAALLAPILPIATRPTEDLAATAARLETVRKLEREVAALERKIRTEPQFNRKAELRRTLRTKQADLASLAE